MSSISKVAVVGASGNVGPAVVNALLNKGFEVTALTRESSTATFPAAVSVKRVNFTSKDSLVFAFQGQDAVVSCISFPATGGQDLILDAAIEAKVKRFLPSDYGIDYMSARSSKVAQTLKDKVKTIEYLQEVTLKHPWFTYTSLATSLLFDWGLPVGLFGFDFVNKTATIVDSGNEPFSTSNLATVGQAVAAVLTHPKETANKTVKVFTFTTTQNEILRLLEKESGEKWQVNRISKAELEKFGDDKEAAGDPLTLVFRLQLYAFPDGAGTAWKKEETFNELLGLKSEEDIQGTIRRVLKL